MNSKSRGLVIAVRIAIIMTVLLLLTYFIALVTGYGPYFESAAANHALINIKTDSEVADELLQKEYDKLYIIADVLADAQTKSDIIEVLDDYIGSDDFGDLRYFSGGVEYDPKGFEIEENVYEAVKKLAEARRVGCSGSYYDSTVGMDCTAFYVPVSGSPAVDGILSVMPSRNMIDLKTLGNKNADAMILMTRSGAVLTDIYGENFKYTVGKNFFDFVRTATHNKEEYDDAYHATGDNKSTAFPIYVGGKTYIVATHVLPASDNAFQLVVLNEIDNLLMEGDYYVRNIIVISIIVSLSLVGSLVYAFFIHRKKTDAMIAATLMDPRVGCPNAESFKNDCLETFSTEGTENIRFVILSTELRQFKYLEEQLGEETMNELLRFIANTLQNFCGMYETYGYAGSGKFYILYREAKSVSLENRVRLLNTVINKHLILKTHDITTKLYVGVYRVDQQRDKPYDEMLACAAVARSIAKNNVREIMAFYTAEVNAQFERNAKIEGEMENALKNREFKLFMQPKYNIAGDCIDSAEALVRWFDTSTSSYIFPVEFISLFETNGFIVKLDHFMFHEVCQYFADAMAHEDKIVPVSVNVSRVTALEDGFLDFYIGLKKKYMIPDNFLVFEFTESFAMESYDTIFHIVTTLHRNGIRCSIDDFGSGYSSFSILKEIPMDEIKFDTFFIKEGHDKGRDKHLYRTLVDLAKTFKMTVVQEGVETNEVYERIKAYGCDVMQGFYYAKAIPLEEYKLFVASNTSLRYKSKVK